MASEKDFLLVSISVLSTSHIHKEHVTRLRWSRHPDLFDTKHIFFAHGGGGGGGGGVGVSTFFNVQIMGADSKFCGAITTREAFA